MSFNWADYLELAKALGDTQTPLAVCDEARQRAAISRAYYAAFCTVRNHLRTQRNDNTLFADEASHRKVREALVNKNTRLADTLAKLLLETHRERKRADYEDVYDSADNLPGVLSRVKRILELLAQNP